jgi:murein L,D-transpeptidase YcbB/YkuD
MDWREEGLSFEMNGLMARKSGRFRALMLFTALAATAVAPAVAQVPPTRAPAAARAAPVPGPKAAPQSAIPANPDLAPEQAAPAQPAPVPPPLPPAIWDVASAQQLLTYIEGIGAEGLNPADYDPQGLEAALASGDVNALSAAATQRFNLVSSDLALGHVKKPARIDWFLADKDLDAAKQDALLRAALAQHDIPAALDGLLPTHPQYGALKAALAKTPAGDTARRDRIRLNMDRWRWLPRELGSKYIIVNVPSFHATLVQDGVTRWKQRAIAGKLSTPTPELSALATGVILNPWWEVPKSIEHEAAGKKGFVPVTGPDGEIQRWRQPPGPTNALGQLKFVMPNSKAIYLHDTNARSRFNDSVRALSHGCVRTQHVLDLATLLLGDDNGQWTPDRIQAALASKKTVEASFVKPVPVYIVYFSDAALIDGSIIDYKDLYNRDAKAIQALNMRDGGASLVPPKPKPEDVAGTAKPAQKPADKIATR